MKSLQYILAGTLLFFFLIERSWAVQGADIAIYVGPGAWSDGVIAFENFLDWKGLTHERVLPEDVNTVNLQDFYQGIYFPGGDAYYYKLSIDATGLQHIRDLVNNGGAYIGNCAGTYFASDSIFWEGAWYDYPLDLFDGVAIGAIDEIAPWPNYVMTTVNMNPDNPINQYEPASEVMLYYGGPHYLPHPGVNIDTTATWAAYFDKPAIINFTYGSGRVLLMGPHPEIEEDDDRDGTDFAQELDDQGTDWRFLWTALDWVLGRPISNPDQALPVVLSRFSAFFQQKSVILEWETQAEIENQGFIILRSEMETEGYRERASYRNRPGLRGAGNSTRGHRYRFEDRSVSPGKTYWYKLVSVDYNGVRHVYGPVTAVAGLAAQGKAPRSYFLAQNFPNPFNPITIIRFGLPEGGGTTHTVRLEIYSARGEKIRTLVNGRLAAGTFEFTWDGRDEQGRVLPSGVYFYWLCTSRYTAVRKMLLVK